jgi:hypothetical protein
MTHSEFLDVFSDDGNQSRTSKYRVARWRERKKRGVLFVAGLEVYERDLQVLKRVGCLANDNPAVVGKDEVEAALWRLMDGLARHFGILSASSGSPTNASA